MKKHLFARILRASGRLLLFVGAALGFGLTFVEIYLFFFNLFNPEKTSQLIVIINGENVPSTTDNGEFFPTFAATTACVLGVIILLGIIAVLYNKYMRRIITKVAHLFRAQIFTVEIVATLIAWTVTTLLLACTIPMVSIVAIFAFLINELLFIFAWGAYGQPNYKI